MKGFVFLIAAICLLAGCKSSTGEKTGFLQQVSERSTVTCGTYTVAEIAFAGGVSTENGMKNAQEFVVDNTAKEAAHRLVGEFVTIHYTSGFEFCGPTSTIVSVTMANRPTLH